MVKMAYAPLSRLVSRDTMSSICPINIKPTLSEVLESDSVKRLFNQPNLVIKTTPFKPLAEVSDEGTPWHKKNGVSTMLNYTRPSELSVVSVRTAEEEKEDANLLPSKIEHKKSEIVLFPIKKKLCGHYEPCENIVCDVTLQQYADKDGVSPMLALSIEENEINAPVEKHCGNESCDALSIDHNRCRRAIIKLHRCDRSHACDICGVTFKEWIPRIYHGNCTRKKEYVHNNVNRWHLQKERMRMRELQILENARMKRHDYSDPAKAIETLRRNEELIIIPQGVSSQRPIVIATSVPSTQLISPNLINAQSVKINSQLTTNMFGGGPLAISSQSLGSALSSEGKVMSTSRVRFSNLQQNSHVGSTLFPAAVQARTRVPASASAPALTLTLTSVPTPVATSSPALAPVQTVTLALAPSSAPAPAPTPAVASASASTLTLTLAQNSATVPPLVPAPVAVPPLIPTSAPAPVTTSSSAPVASSPKQYIRLAVSPQTTTVQPIAINNWIVSPAHILTTMPDQSKTFLAPVRVVPIANLISPPSLLHRTQGIPKFCIVAKNMVTPATAPKSPSVQSLVNAAAVIGPKQVANSNIPIRNPTSKVRKASKLKAKKKFLCVYCSKVITTDWYFKMHVAKHKGEKLFFCNFCDESFSNTYDMRKHVTNKHTGQKELACDKCNYTCTSLDSFKSHIRTHAIGLNKADVQSKKQRRLKLSEDKISRKLIRNSYRRIVKRARCEDTADSPNKRAEKHNKLTINIGGNAKKEFNFVSVKEIVEPENFQQESAITSR
ncbi:PREDICTED: transcription factor Sp2-like [Vollenhovia emeryi]|uniref:transcription factor Sp2-like n=1 Tax=Vollenhovia emeryi TaxID=411798 RepID=UPI0005F3A617|nr:PREDICTED: transcription factor Sp2-like [Vollenhovia emeryi]